MTAEMATNTTMSTRIVNTSFPSVRGLLCLRAMGEMRSMVRLAEDAIASEESVDMDADSTKMMTSPMRKGESSLTIAGMMASYPPSAKASG